MKTPLSLLLCLFCTLSFSPFAARAAAPTATTLGASNITAGTATLTGSVNPNSASTKVFFQWGLTTNYGNTSPTQTLASGSSAVLVQRGISNLASLTTYYFRVAASNSSGLRFGTNKSFLSAALPPQTTTLAATNMGATRATLQGDVNPNGLNTLAWFRFYTFGQPVRETAMQAVGAGTNAVRVTDLASELLVQKNALYQMVASNAAGVAMGSELLSTTLCLTDTLAPAAVGTNWALLQATIRAEGHSIGYWFDWSPTNGVGGGSTAYFYVTDPGTVVVQYLLTNLVPATTYHYYSFAFENSSGLGMCGGQFVEFTTQAFPPAITGLPIRVTTNSATLTGSADPRGLATTAYFQWGLTTNYGLATATQAIGPSSSRVSVEADLSALLTYTNYHYRLVVSNALGWAYGGDVSVIPTLLLYLTAGESWTYEFHDLPFIGTFYLGFGGFDIQRVNLAFLSDSFAAGSALQVETFPEGILASGYSHTFVGPASSATWPADYWADRHGAVRFTVLTGSVVVAGVGFHVQHYTYGGVWNYYDNTITPTRYPQPAALGTQFVSSVSLQGVTVSADVNAHNLPTGLFLQWGLTTNYGSTGSIAFVDRDYVVQPALSASNLAPATVYHLRVVATNSGGIALGNDLVVTTPSPATVATQAANNRKTTSATLNATAYVNGLATSGYFEWGATTNYGQTTALQNLGSSMGALAFSAPITGLVSQTTYHYRGVVFSTGVTNAGADAAFITTLPPSSLVVTNLATDDVRGALERGGTVTFAVDGTLVLSNQIEIASDVCLNATGHAVTLSGGNVTRLFQVFPGTLLTLTNVTLANGFATQTGGAIYNDGTVLAYNCRFLSNTVVGASGANGTNGLAGPNGNPPGGGTPGGAGGVGQNVSGGAIFNSGSLTVARCFFANDSATGGAGGIGGNGGNGGTSTLDPRLSRGAYGLGGAGGDGATAQGGAIASFGTLMVNGCTFSNAMAAAGNGGTSGPSGFGGSGIYYYIYAQGGTGGLARGGAVFASGVVVISNTLMSGSKSLGGRGGDACCSGINGPAGNAGGAMGGAVFLVVADARLANCTLFNNRVLGGDIGNGTSSFSTRQYPTAADGVGGAMANAGNLQALNLTILSNTATGGASRNSNGLVILGSSLGGSIANTGGVFQIVNSILSGGTSNNAFGVITDLGHNLSSDATPAWTSGTSLNDTDPLLLPLASNGGPTWTMGLRAGSPALNTADCTAAPPTDQRGFARPNGPGCDLGAYEGAGLTTLSIARESAGTNVVRNVAEPGRAYRLEKTVTFSVWTPVMTNTAPVGGLIEFHVPVTGSPCFYRVVPQ